MVVLNPPAVLFRGKDLCIFRNDLVQLLIKDFESAGSATNTDSIVLTVQDVQSHRTVRLLRLFVGLHPNSGCLWKGISFIAGDQVIRLVAERWNITCYKNEFA